ncbi:MAG: putative bifunctional diguanylate cyclase/phosphodiesterase [Burkholderiales bacterium]
MIVRLALDPWLDGTLSHPTVFTAILLATWYCGVGPAVFIAIAGYPAIEYLIRDAPFSEGPEYLAATLGLYTGLVAIIVFFVSRFRREHLALVATEGKLTRSEQRIRACVDHAALGIVEIDSEHRLTAVNERMCRILGYQPAQLAGIDLDRITAPADQLRARELMRKLRQGELEHLDYEVRYLRANGSVIWAHTTLSAIRDARGPHHCIGTVEDITGRKQAEQELHDSKEQFEQLATHIPEAFWITDLEKHAIIYVSPAFERIHGRPLQSVRSVWRAWKDTLHPDDRDRALEAHRKMAEGPVDVQYRIVRPDGETRWVHACGYPVENEQRVVYRIAGTIEDITERREMENRLQYQAHFDSLTGLPNRVLFFDRLAQALTQAQRASQNVGLLFIDVDRFKIVNDTLGHLIGDKLLQRLAQRLVKSVRAEDTVARLGGDEFAIILPHIDKPENAALIAKKALRGLARPLRIDGNEVVVTGSIGVAISSSDGVDAPTLLKNADTAMFRAKNSGRNGYEFYTSEMNQRALEQLHLERQLRRALGRNEFVLHFQPKRNVAGGEITGCEGLLRWISPDLSALEPLAFVPLLEESGLIIQVGEWVIHAACKQIAQWQREGARVLPIAVNVSAKQFNQRKFADVIESALRENAVEGSLLEIELTESTAMQNAEETIAVLGKLKALGVRIAIDDFGTGHSSLSYLKRLPIDVLKIDRSFITGLPDNENDASITKAIITMAHSLGLKVIAEGVEHERQLDFLAQNGCDEVQGYLFSPAVSAVEIGAYVQARAGSLGAGAGRTVH